MDCTKTKKWWLPKNSNFKPYKYLVFQALTISQTYKSPSPKGEYNKQYNTPFPKKGDMHNIHPFLSLSSPVFENFQKKTRCPKREYDREEINSTIQNVEKSIHRLFSLSFLRIKRLTYSIPSAEKENESSKNEQSYRKGDCAYCRFLRDGANVTCSCRNHNKKNRTDRLDAQTIARFGTERQPKPTNRPSKTVLALKELTHTTR